MRFLFSTIAAISAADACANPGESRVIYIGLSVLFACYSVYFSVREAIRDEKKSDAQFTVGPIDIDLGGTK